MANSLDRYYRILGLSHDASKIDIKRAYRRMALKYHPDKNPYDQKRAARIFIAVNKAYSILMDKAHLGEPLDDIDDAKFFFRRHFYDLARRINSADYIYDEIQQEECDFFFRYQLEEVHYVRRSSIEARRIIDLLRKAISKGYDISEILKDHSEFFQKHGFYPDQEYDDYKQLVSEYKRIIEEEPGNAEAHCNLGIIYEKRGMIDAAISEYRMALYIDPRNARAKRASQRLGVKK